MESRPVSPGKNAQRTAKWARIMTKWLVTYSNKKGTKWNLVEFGGLNGGESRGIVDIMAIRKNHKLPHPGLKRGDLFEIVLIQTKGGSAQPPTKEDIDRLSVVARYYKAKAIVLGVWQRKQKLALFQLKRKRWHPVKASEIFG